MRYLWIEIVLCTVTGINTAAFVAIWFSTAHKEIAHAKRCVKNEAAQLRLHTESYPQSQDGPNRTVEAQGLDTARMIFREVVKSYNAVRQSPMNRFPAWILGYHPESEDALL